jgi:SAM-dependent methyltransferase
MNRQRAQRRLWAWHLSALVYEWSYVQVAHQIDEDVLAFLGERLIGALVADCGCGPGVVTEKLLRAGASLVVAIDGNASMIKRARARLAKDIASGKVLVYHGSYEAETLAGIREQALAGRGFDLVLFKRSLYMPRPRALCTLRTAAASLCTRGLIVVAHPERSLWRYACAPPFGFTSYTPLHIVNRVVSRVLEWSGSEEYTLYTRAELLGLLHEAVPGAHVQRLLTPQRPYNLVALQVP